MSTETLSIRIDSAMKEKLEALAEQTQRSKSFLAAEAIAAYVELESWQIGEIRAGVAELDARKGIDGGSVRKSVRSLLQKGSRRSKQ